VVPGLNFAGRFAESISGGIDTTLRRLRHYLS